MVNKTELQLCVQATNDPANEDTHQTPVLTNFIIMEDTGGSSLMHAYGEMVELVGNHFTPSTQGGYAEGSANDRAEYCFSTLEDAADSCKQRRPLSMPARAKRVQEIIEQARMPGLLCAEEGKGETFVDIVHKRATLYTNQFKQEPGEEMLHLFGTSLRNIL